MDVLGIYLYMMGAVHAGKQWGFMRKSWFCQGSSNRHPLSFRKTQSIRRVEWQAKEKKRIIGTNH